MVNSEMCWRAYLLTTGKNNQSNQWQSFFFLCIHLTVHFTIVWVCSMGMLVYAKTIHLVCLSTFRWCDMIYLFFFIFFFVFFGGWGGVPFYSECTLFVKESGSLPQALRAGSPSAVWTNVFSITRNGPRTAPAGLAGSRVSLDYSAEDRLALRDPCCGPALSSRPRLCASLQASTKCCPDPP